MDEHVGYLRRLFASSSEFEVSVNDLITYCRTIDPVAHWDLLQDLNWDAEARAFGAWLERSAPEEPVSSGVQAYYFGLSDDGTSVHLDGCAEFDATDESCDWACSWVYRPEEDWTDSTALDTFSSISEATDDGVPILPYLLCLGFAGLLAKRYVRTTLWRAEGAQRPVAVGFDSGDAYIVLRPEPSAD
jgi:hypothetical protein